MAKRLGILETLGDPPDVSHPIYIITVEDGVDEEVVYVGKSASNLSRFSGGHSTAMKLLDPKYNTHKKYVYLCQVMLYSTNDEYLPLEFVAHKKLALELLDDVESMLINDFKPAFNTMKMKSYSVNHKFTLQIQKSFSDSNAIEDNSFMQNFNSNALMDVLFMFIARIFFAFPPDLIEYQNTSGRSHSYT